MNGGTQTLGFSDAAQFVEDSARRGRQHLNESSAFGIDSAVRDELATVWEDCRTPNWDGFGALPVSQETLRHAYVLLETLPLGFPAPSIGAEPDGQLTLEWYRSPRRTLSLSVDPVGDLHYAAIFGPNRAFGTEAFFDEIPTSILQLIQRLDAT